jgi:hypothetical protein
MTYQSTTHRAGPHRRARKKSAGACQGKPAESQCWYVMTINLPCSPSKPDFSNSPRATRRAPTQPSRSDKRARRGGGRKPWRQMSPDERMAETERQRRYRRRRYIRDPAYKAQMVAKIARLVARRGGDPTRRGRTGWPP